MDKQFHISMFISNITIIILWLHFTIKGNCLAEGSELIVDSKARTF